MMTQNQNLLLHLIEECLEVGQRCSKAMKFGIKEIQSGQLLDNAERIKGEMADLMGVYKILADDGILLWPEQADIEAKKPRVEKYLVLSQKLGQVSDNK